MTNTYYSAKEVAFALGVDVSTIRKNGTQLNMKKREGHWRFTENEMARLRKHIILNKQRQEGYHRELPSTLKIDIKKVSLKDDLLLPSIGDTRELIERIEEWVMDNDDAFIRDVMIEKITEK